MGSNKHRHIDVEWSLHLRLTANVRLENVTRCHRRIDRSILSVFSLSIFAGGEMGMGLDISLPLTSIL